MSIIEATFFTGPKSRPVHHDLDGVLDAIKHGVQAASTPQAAVDVLVDLVQPRGWFTVDCIVFQRALSRWGQDDTRYFFHESGFPRDWSERWPRYAMVDPIIPAAAGSLWPVEIDDLQRAGSSSALQREFWGYLMSSGVASGYSIPVHLPGGAFAAIAFYRPAKSEHHADGLCDQLLVIGQVFCRMLVQRFALVPGLTPDANVSLTDREKECLYWTSVGKTTEDIAEIIGRATQTVRFHLDSASRKLGAVNRTSAVAQACSRGLIDPHCSLFASTH